MRGRRRSATPRSARRSRSSPSRWPRLPSVMIAAALAAAAFSFSAGPIEGEVRDRVVGSSWRKGCPVGLADLRYLRIGHRTFDGGTRTRRADRPRGRRPRHPARLRPPVSQALPDPPHAARGRLRRQRLPLHRGRQHVRLQLPPRGGLVELVRARLRTRDRRQPDREPVRHRERDDVAVQRRSPISTAATTARGWRPRRRKPCAPSRTQGWGWGGTWSPARDYQHFSAAAHSLSDDRRAGDPRGRRAAGRRAGRLAARGAHPRARPGAVPRPRHGARVRRARLDRVRRLRRRARRRHRRPGADPVRGRPGRRLRRDPAGARARPPRWRSSARSSPRSSPGSPRPGCST